jgi:predicted O-methyltransferase YrrM
MSVRVRHLCVRELIPMLLPAQLYLRSPIFEDVCRALGHKRLFLPPLDVEAVLPGFGDAVVQVPYLPDHDRTSPVADQIALAKLAKVTDAARVLEVGSYRGDTALTLALNTRDTTRVVAVDTLEEHGRAYRGHPLERKITRHVGALATLPEQEPFDVIFIDADHRYESVCNDTMLALPRLAPRGWIVWHDYYDSGWLAGWNRVPEFLNELAEQLEIAVIPRTPLAVHYGGWRSRP